MNIKAMIGNNIAVKYFSKEETTKSGIILTKNAKEDEPEFGEVFAVGPDCEGIDVGQMILFKKYAPDKIKIGADELLFLTQDDVLAIVQEI